MAKDAYTDPFTAWRAWFDQSERQLNAAFNELMSTDEFKASQGRTMEAFLQFQRSMGERSQELLSLANLPSRTDLAALGERLDSIDRRLEAIEAGLGDGTQAAPPAASGPRPKRTRKPPKDAPAAPKKGAGKSGRSK